MNNIYMEAFNYRTFSQDVNESDISKIKCYNLHNLIFQHLPVIEKATQIEDNRMRNEDIIDTLTSVDIQQIV